MDNIKEKTYAVMTNITAAPRLTYNFADQTAIKNKIITAIQTFNVADVTVSPNNFAVLNAAAFLTGYLVLVEIQKNIEVISKIPLSALRTAVNAGLLRRFNFNDIDWQKSYVAFPAIAPLVANEDILFTFYYKDKE